jgi:hypothetical protein
MVVIARPHNSSTGEQATPTTCACQRPHQHAKVPARLCLQGVFPPEVHDHAGPLEDEPDEQPVHLRVHAPQGLCPSTTTRLAVAAAPARQAASWRTRNERTVSPVAENLTGRSERSLERNLDRRTTHEELAQQLPSCHLRAYGALSTGNRPHATRMPTGETPGHENPAVAPAVASRISMALASTSWGVPNRKKLFRTSAAAGKGHCEASAAAQRRL